MRMKITVIELPIEKFDQFRLGTGMPAVRYSRLFWR